MLPNSPSNLARHRANTTSFENVDVKRVDKLRSLVESEKVITTILSFDGLLLNFSIRQINSENSRKSVTEADITVVPPAHIRTHNKRFSMANPLYSNNFIDSQEIPTKLKSAKLSSQKYHAKIDTNLRINNLTQEVNMPLLRLAHQLYSIIADAIDYDKEQNKLMYVTSTNASAPLEEPDNHEIFPLMSDLKQMNYFNRNSLNRSIRHVVGTRKDCWKFMDEIVDSKEMVPGAKYTEKDEISSKKPKAVNTAEKVKATVVVNRDNLVLTIFGRINIKKIKSKAALGTLAFNGEMNNVQLSLTFAQKNLGRSFMKLNLFLTLLNI